MQKEIASYIFLRGKVFDYCVYENGKVTRTAKAVVGNIYEDRDLLERFL